MPIERVRRDAAAESVRIGPHYLQRAWENGLSVDQILDVIRTGAVLKTEPDERSSGKFAKITLRKADIMVVVKDCQPSFVITARRRR